MKAIVQHRYGRIDQLRVEDVADPVAGAGEVLVRVRAAGVDRGTVHVMTGLPLVGRAVLGPAGAAGDAPRPRRRRHGRGGGGGRHRATQSGTRSTSPPAGRSPSWPSHRPPGGPPTWATFRSRRPAAVPVSAITALQAVRARPRHGRRPGARHRCVGRGRLVRRAARRRPRRAGHRGLRPDQGRPGALARGRSRRRPHDDPSRRSASASTWCSTSPATVRCGCCAAAHRTGSLVVVGSEGGGRWLGGLQRAMGVALLSPFVGQRLVMLIASEDGADLAAITEVVERGACTRRSSAPSRSRRRRRPSTTSRAATLAARSSSRSPPVSARVRERPSRATTSAPNSGGEGQGRLSRR